MNENDIVDVPTTDVGDEIAAEKVETKADIKSEGTVMTDQERINERIRLERQYKRLGRKLGIEQEESDKPVSQKPFELGLTEKSFLNANGIKGKEEYDLVAEYVTNSRYGNDIESIIESGVFNKELKEIREMRQSKMASDAASGSKRGQQSARDTVEYWLAKGDDVLPPPYQVQLRRDVVNARIKRDGNQSPFKNS